MTETLKMFFFVNISAHIEDLRSIQIIFCEQKFTQKIIQIGDDSEIQNFLYHLIGIHFLSNNNSC